MKSPINRVDTHEDTNEITVISTDVIEGLNHALSGEHEDFFVTIRSNTVRIHTAAQMKDNATTWELHGNNLIYYETTLTERSLTQEEITWCEDTFMYSGSNRPEQVHEFTIPHPDTLREHIKNGELSAFNELKSTIHSEQGRDRLVSDMQSNIEEQAYITNQLSNSNIYDVPPETRRGIENHGIDATKATSKARNASYFDTWETIAKSPYYRFKNARYNALDLHEPYLDDHRISGVVALDLIDKSEHEYCRECVAVLPEADFLHVEKRGKSYTVRICESCANIYDKYTDKAISKARDHRAKKHGGQRNLNGSF